MLRRRPTPPRPMPADSPKELSLKEVERDLNIVTSRADVVRLKIANALLQKALGPPPEAVTLEPFAGMFPPHPDGD